ncbi:hypothetical protein CTI12_AA219480 [Artemisia annua]|uniref:Uncharacterized protein n=1 Tax=Artemisia annua TaxID=35608 RepID=A0A2U1NXJ5_ARTAN|nr:hypothetical protein CTI12_AA219480 [Artemisia annua]
MFIFIKNFRTSSDDPPSRPSTTRIVLEGDLGTLNCLQRLVVDETENWYAISHMERQRGVTPRISPLAQAFYRIQRRRTYVTRHHVRIPGIGYANNEKADEAIVQPIEGFGVS